MTAPLHRVIGRAEDWLWAPAPAARLALFRILVGLFATVYLAVRLPAFLAMARLDAGFEPVGILWFLDQPLAPGLVRTLVWATLGLAVAATVGVGWRVTGPAFALGLLVVATYRSSWGRLLYFDNLLVLHALILAPTRAADVYSPRSWRRSPSPGATVYGWPLRLCALVTVVTYVLAGVAKLRIGGLGWMDGETLGNHIAYSAARLRVLGGTPSPLAGVLVQAPWLLTPMAAATVVLELGAPAALWSRLRVPWVAGIWVMHAAIAASMLVVFPYPLFLVAFAPLFHLERLPPILRRIGPGGLTGQGGRDRRGGTAGPMDPMGTAPAG